MFAVLVIISILFALVLTASAGTKLMKAPQAVEGLDRAKVPHSWYPGLAALEVAGAAGIVIGLGVTGLGIAAAIGVIAYSSAPLRSTFVPVIGTWLHPSFSASSLSPC